MLTLANRLLLAASSFMSIPSVITTYADGAGKNGFGPRMDYRNNVAALAWYISDTVPYGVVLATDDDGTVVWQRKLTHANSVFIQYVKQDASGNVYVLGHCSTTDRTICLLKYNSAGTLQWQRAITKTSSGSNINARALFVASTGDVYLVVQHTISSYAGYNLLKYNSTGTLQWQTQVTATSLGIGTNATLAEDASGNIYLLTDQGSTYRVVLRKYNNAGALLTHKAYYLSGGSIPAPGGLAIDGSGNIYLAGPMGAASNYPTVIKLNSSLTHQWTRTIQQSDFASVREIRCPAAGGIALAADEFYGRLDASGNITLQRRVVATSVDAGLYGVDDQDFLRFAGQFRTSSAPRTDVGFGKVNVGSDVGTYDMIVVSEPAAYTVSTTAATETTVTWTEGSGSLTDAAGSLTDAAGSLTATVHSRV